MSMRRLPEGYIITPGAPEDVADLVFADLAASRLFAGTGYVPDSGLTEHVPIPLLEAAMHTGHLSVVRFRGDAVGFALTSAREGSLYLDQISVDPAHGRKGLGMALMRGVIDGAGRHGRRDVTLSTFRDLPWNGQFYRKLGFRELPRRRMKPWMQEIEMNQRANGLDVTKRCFMIRRASRL